MSAFAAPLSLTTSSLFLRPAFRHTANLRGRGVWTQKQCRLTMAAPDFSNGAVLLAKKGPDGVLGDCPFTQKANMALRARGVHFQVELVDLSAKPDWFLDLNEDGSTPTFVEGANVLTSSDDIVEHADEIGKSGSALYSENNPKWDAAFDVVAPLFSAFVKLIKNKGDDAPFMEELTKTLAAIDAHLRGVEGRFLIGDELSALDCNLGPKLYHVLVAGKHYKGFELPDSLSALSEYMRNIRSTPEWKETAATDDVIIWGWSKFF